MAVLALAAILLLAAGMALARRGAWSSVALPGVAAAFGAVFQATSFGYASAFRAWLTRGDGSGLAAGVLVAALAALVIVPVSALGSGYGGYGPPLETPLVASI